MEEDHWRMGFHIMPRSGILDAPIVINQEENSYQLYYQHRRDSTTQDSNWTHISSPNLVYWHYEDTDADKIKPALHKTDQAELAAVAAQDYGFDFSAPASLVDAEGRTIIFALMANSNAPYSAAPNGLSWTNCLTVPRELTYDERHNLLQYPVKELDALRMHENRIDPLVGSLFPEHRADVVFSDIDSTSNFKIDLDEGCHISYSNGMLSLSFTDMRIGAGRNICKAKIGALYDLRILVDSSSIEVFANKGIASLTSRWFPRSKTFLVSCSVKCANATAWTMDDVLYLTYE